MEDATKATARNLFEPLSEPVETAPLREGLSAPQAAEPELSTDEKAHDRWFLEQRGSKKVPKRLEIPNEVLVLPGGPLKVMGNISLIEEDGTVTHAHHLTLCRCGASKSRPVCDEKHLDIEFFDTGNIQRASDCMPMNRPQTLTITCVPDGPLKLRGYVKIHNRKGQQFLTLQTTLCRCGKSTNKPFCDCK